MRKPATSLWCLHGNLQRPGVWRSLEGALHCRSGPDGERVALPLRSEDLWAQHEEELWSWARAFCDRVERETSTERSQVLIGYSLGGRLAFHAILERRWLWRAAIIVAAHPGLEREEDRRACLERDHAWARRFRSEPWEQVLAAWDAQPIFGGRAAPGLRGEADFSREAVARLLELWSKGRQEPLLERLRALEGLPILYLSGEHDLRYRAIGDQLAAVVPTCRQVVIPGAQHRVPWEAPRPFLETVQRFLDEAS